MRRIKQVWRTLNHVSTAVWIWGVGGSLVVTTGLGWAAQAQADMPAGWLALGSAGVAIISFMAVATGLTKLFPQWATGQERAAWQQLRDEATDAEYLQEKAQTELSEQTERNEKLLRENKGLIDERDLWKIKSEMLEREFERVKGELAVANLELDKLRTPPPPLPVAPMNKELVIAIKTYGLPAYRILFGVLEQMFEPVRSEPGIGKFLPGLYLEARADAVKKAAERLSFRIAAVDSVEAFEPIWSEFHWGYTQELMFWVGRVHFFYPIASDVRVHLAEWLVEHDKYYSRVRELGNAPDGEQIAGTYERFEATTATHRQRLVDALSSQAPDTGGS